MKLKIRSKEFEFVCEANETSIAFQKMLPLTLQMQELNRNEKYFYLDERLPTKPVAVKKINAGDIMLYGDNCLVIFYKSFSTSYEYTMIGRVTNPDDLVSALGKGSIAVEVCL